MIVRPSLVRPEFSDRGNWLPESKRGVDVVPWAWEEALYIHLHVRLSTRTTYDNMIIENVLLCTYTLMYYSTDKIKWYAIPAIFILS